MILCHLAHFCYQILIYEAIFYSHNTYKGNWQGNRDTNETLGANEGQEMCFYFLHSLLFPLILLFISGFSGLV